jgi:sugar phosphate isomerase/epimerase
MDLRWFGARQDMAHLRIGLRLECLRLPVRKALRQAAALRVKGVQLDASGDLAPGNLSATGRKELLRLVHSLGLELFAIGFPARSGFTTEQGLDDRVRELKRVLTLSYELQAPIVTGAIGRIPEDPDHPARQLVMETMADIGAHADRVGAVFAAETGSESGAALRRFIDSIHAVGIRAAVDPASLLIKGYDPIQAVRDLNEYVVHALARDAVREGGGGLSREATPGDGALDWNEYLGALEEAGYRGSLTIVRHEAADPVREIARAVSFLQRF